MFRGKDKEAVPTGKLSAPDSVVEKTLDLPATAAREPASGSVQLRVKFVLVASLTCFYAAELGYLIDVYRMGTPPFVISLLAFFAAFPLVYLFVRQLSAASAFLGGQRFASLLLFVVSLAAGCLLCSAHLLITETYGPGFFTAIGLGSFVTGAVCALGMLNCQGRLAERHDAKPLPSFVIALLCGLVLFGGIYWLEAPIRVLVFTQLVSLGSLILLVCGRSLRTAPGEDAGSAGAVASGTSGQGNSDAKRAGIEAQAIHLNRFTHFTMFAFQLTLGYCLGIASMAWDPLVACLALALTLCLGIAAYRLSGHYALALGELGKVVLPACIALLFCAVPGLAVTNGLVLALAVMFFLLFETMNSSWLARTASLFGLNSIKHIASGRLPLAAGTLVGLLLGSGAQMAAGLFAETLQPVFVHLIMSGFIAVVVVMAYTFLPFNQGTPVKEGILKRNMKDIEKLGPGRQGRPFKEFCTRVGERYGLTPREQEVLFLLACGYNSETIADILIVSASTARTHIYRIYQKTGFHSQQELMRSIEGEYGGSDVSPLRGSVL